MALQRTLGPPVQLSDPLALKAPEPVRGCDVCAACARQWKEASNPNSVAYDPSHATDLAVEISRHPHPRKKVRQ